MNYREDIWLIENFIDKSDLNKKIWRYMSLKRFESVLKNSELHFASAEQFNKIDNHEGAITSKEYESRKNLVEKSVLHENTQKKALSSIELAFKGLREYTKISCWHINEYENVAMWNYYENKKKGIAVETTIKFFLDNIGPYSVQESYGLETINVALIKYINYLKEKMPDRFGFLTTFLYKRINYAYENEVRFIISLRAAAEFGVNTPKAGILVPFNYNNGIKRIILSPNSDNNFKQEVQAIVTKYGANIPISNSELKIIPKY